MLVLLVYVVYYCLVTGWRGRRKREEQGGGEEGGERRKERRKGVEMRENINTEVRVAGAKPVVLVNLVTVPFSTNGGQSEADIALLQVYVYKKNSH